MFGAFQLFTCWLRMLTIATVAMVSLMPFHLSASPLDYVEARKADRKVEQKKEYSREWQKRCHCAFNLCLTSYPKDCDSSCMDRIREQTARKNQVCRTEKGDIQALDAVVAEIKAEAAQDRAYARQQEREVQKKLEEIIRKQQQNKQARLDAVQAEREAKLALSREKHQQHCEATLAQGRFICGCESFAPNNRGNACEQ